MMHRLTRATALICLLQLSPAPCLSAPTTAQFVGGASRDVLAGDFVEVQLEGLAPDSEIELRAERVVFARLLGGKRVRFRSQARFLVGPDGRLDLASARPLAGSYAGVDPRGLFWSMQVTDEPVAPATPIGEVRIGAWAGAQEIAHLEVKFRTKNEGLRREEIAEFPGAVLLQPPPLQQQAKARKRAVIVLLGGAEGGSQAAAEEAPKLASRGFVVLGLPYYSPPAMPGGPRELPALPADFADIPLERLEQVRDWIATRADLDADRIVLYGASKGAEYALLAASHFDWVHAVVAVAPSDVVWEGFGWGVGEAGTRASFALHGKPLAFVPMQGFVEEYTAFFGGGDLHMRRPHDRGRASFPERVAAARIPVERFKGPLLLLAGQDDQLWNAAAMAHNILERRVQAGLPTIARIYSDAGHYLNGNGWAPTTHYDAGREKSGGTPAGNARAQADAWQHLQDFLAAHAR